MIVACVAPGPSLTRETCERLAGKCRVLAINNAWELCPWADWLYACDGPWWDEYHRKVAAGYRGECWTQDLTASRKYGLHHVQSAPAPERFSGLSRTPGVVHTGCNGGYQAINLALHFGATRILLVGYDMQGTHFFGEYANPNLRRESRDFARWIECYETIQPADYGLDILNCTLGSALLHFPFMEIDHALHPLPKAA